MRAGRPGYGLTETCAGTFISVPGLHVRPAAVRRSTCPRSCASAYGLGSMACLPKTCALLAALSRVAGPVPTFEA